MIRVIEHRDQQVDDFRHEEMIKELATAIAHIGILVPKPSRTAGRASRPQRINARYTPLA
jgi:hypothetical protein